MIGVSAGPILAAFGPVPTAVDMPVGVLRRKHEYKKKKKKKYKLRLPDDLLGIYPTFHVKAIKAYIPNHDNRFPSRKNTKLGPLREFENEDRYEIEKIPKS